MNVVLPKRVRLLMPALLLTGMALVFSATPSQAHDQLRATNPADGAALAQPPAQLELEFNSDVLTIAPAVVLRDARGNDLTSAEPTVNGRFVSLPWPADQIGGDFSVVWRVVSSDGHPIQGSFGFSVTAPAATVTTTPGAAHTETTTTAEAGAVPTSPGPTTAAAVAGGDEGTNTTTVAVATVGLVTTTLLVAAAVVWRRRTRRRPTNLPHPLSPSKDQP